MPRFDPRPALPFTASAVSTARDAIAQSPGWVRVGLSFDNTRLRDEALTALAMTIVARLENPPMPFDENQLPLEL